MGNVAGDFFPTSLRGRRKPTDVFSSPRCVSVQREPLGTGRMETAGCLGCSSALGAGVQALAVGACRNGLREEDEEVL